jgi:hypothetical protein
MYLRLTARRKRVAIMLLRPDHTEQETSADNWLEQLPPRDSAGKI